MKKEYSESAMFEMQYIGTMQVPCDFRMMGWILEFMELHREKTHFDLSPSIITKNPTNFVYENDRISVSVVNQIVPVTTTLERLQFLHDHNSLLLGVFGAALVLEHLFESLPVGKDIQSFDHPNYLRRQKSVDPLQPHRMLSKIYKGTNKEDPFFYFEETPYVSEATWNPQTQFFHYKLEKAGDGERHQNIDETLFRLPPSSPLSTRWPDTRDYRGDDDLDPLPYGMDDDCI